MPREVTSASYPIMTPGQQSRRGPLPATPSFSPTPAPAASLLFGTPARRPPPPMRTLVPTTPAPSRLRAFSAPSSPPKPSLSPAQASSSSSGSPVWAAVAQSEPSVLVLAARVAELEEDNASLRAENERLKGTMAGLVALFEKGLVLAVDGLSES